MPEGDTIFRATRSLSKALAGQPITGFRSNYPMLTRFHEDTPLTGQQVDRVEPRGKWLLMYFSGGGILVTHMLMSGSWHIYRPDVPWQKPASQMRVVIETDRYHAVAFNVPIAQMHTSQSLSRDRRIPQPAADVLNPQFDLNAVRQRLLASAHEETADVLMHQHVLAGLGNVFKSEVCFASRVNPFCRVADLVPEQVEALLRNARRLLAENVTDESGNNIVTYRGRRRRTTHAADPGASLWVYGRKGQLCRNCGTLIRSRLQGPGARMTFWCPQCQPMPDGSDVDGA